MLQRATTRELADAAARTLRRRAVLRLVRAHGRAGAAAKPRAEQLDSGIVLCSCGRKALASRVAEQAAADEATLASSDGGGSGDD